MITKEQFENGYTYSEYRKLIDALVAKGQTTGTTQSDDLIKITAMNADRMKRLDNTTQLDGKLLDRLQNMPCPVKWLIIVEGWCKDAAQNVPILNKMAEADPNLELRLILRDEHPEIMDQYLTNGSRSIPKLIILDGDMNEIATWGPRPKEIQEQVVANKKSGKIPFSEFSKVVQKWYAKNKGVSLEKEMMGVLSSIGCVLDE